VTRSGGVRLEKVVKRYATFTALHGIDRIFAGQNENEK